MERDYGGACSPPLSDGENYGITAPKLSALFAMEQQKLQSGNSSFRYHPPKLSGFHSTSSMSAKGVTPVAVTGFTMNTPGVSESENSGPSLQVLHSVAVLKLLISNSSGGKNFIGNAGMAVLESSSSQTKSYQLVLYDASKKTLSKISINHDFQCTPKAVCCVNFDTSNETWSALFSSTEDWVDFATAVVLARSLVARVSRTFSDVIIQDISPHQDTVQTGLREGDMAQVTYKAWIERPGFPGTLGHCFQETAGKGKKLELGSGKAIKGLERGVIGMTKSSRRLLIIPPHLAYGSSSERPDKIPDDAVLFFDVTVSRTRRQKGLASEASYCGRELLLDQLSYNGDAGSEREELIASESRNMGDDLKVVQTVSRKDGEGAAEEDKELSYEKKELLIDRMAKLSRMGGAGCYNLPPSSVVAHQRRSSETSQPVSPSSVDTTPRKFPMESLQHSSLVVEHSNDPSSEDQVRYVDSAVEAKTEPGVKRREEDELSEPATQLTEGRKMDDEHPKLGDALADTPLETKHHPEKVESALNSTNSETGGHRNEDISSCYVPGSSETVYSLSNPDALRPESAGTSSPSSSPALPVPWAQGPPFAYTPFAFPTAPGTLPTNSGYVPPYSFINPTSELPPMGTFSCAPAAPPGQTTHPYLSHPGLFPWFPWSFPPYAPQPFSTTESKHITEQLNLLHSIQQAQESFAESLKELNLKVDALVKVCNKRSGSQENEQSSGNWSLGLGPGCKGTTSQVSSEDGDNQVDSLVESVALMLAENKELRRRLSEYKLQSPSAMGPSTVPSFLRVISNTQGDQGSEELGVKIPELDSAPKADCGLELGPPVGSPRVSSGGGTEMSRAFEDDMKLVMDQVCREVAEELRQGEDVDQILPVVHKKLIEGVDGVIQMLQQQKFGSLEKRSSSLRLPKTQDTHSGSHQEDVGSPPYVEKCEKGGDSASDSFGLDDDLSLQALDLPDGSSKVADHGDFKLLSEYNETDFFL
ncbi:hypothetical protein R1flu_025227 [Riccia fluitans]|uniref:peptidylprolyl isomerase n=1 Tax=Riccia fluitans TaxID=41844 RepID=A0ABD1XX59_9MARC